MQNIF